MRETKKTMASPSPKIADHNGPTNVIDFAVKFIDPNPMCRIYGDLAAELAKSSAIS